MTDRSKELVSAFLDDELSPEELHELCEALDRRPELASTLHQYAAVGSALRSEPWMPMPAVARNVRARVTPHGSRHAEHGRYPDNVIPMPARVTEDHTPERAPQLPVAAPASDRRGKGLRSPVRWRRAVGSLALAASVAVAVVGGLRLLNSGPLPGADAPSVALAEERPAAKAIPAPTLEVESQAMRPNVVTVASEGGRADLRWSVKQRTIEQRLNAYLVQHNEVLRHGVRGMLPYARIVGYKPSSAD